MTAAGHGGVCLRRSRGRGSEKTEGCVNDRSGRSMGNWSIPKGGLLENSSIG